MIEHRAMTTHNDCVLHWKNRNIKKEVVPTNPTVVKNAINEFQQSEGKYIDVPEWQFNPINFSDIMNCLIQLETIRFAKITVFGPVYCRNEFTAILEKSSTVQSSN